MTFTVAGTPGSPRLEWLAGGLRQVLEANGYRHVEQGADDVRLVLNFTDPERPRPYRRKAQATFVVTVVESATPTDNVLKAGYPILVRALSNLVIYLVDRGDDFDTHFVTLEQGHYPIERRSADDAGYFAQLFRRLEPLAASQLVINNEFHTDLPEELWDGDEITGQLRLAGRKLDAWRLLPAPFPIHELLSPQDLRHVKRLYGIGGLSYGNLSARRDATRFWMSASGVNKADLRVIGQDILLVKGFDPERNVMLLSVPPHLEPRRVSVDAIEHWMIYTEHPEVGAIIHVHAWMEGIPSTEVNYPCGTVELARAVAELVRRTDDPSRAVIGLKNHGLTITGRSLQDIFERVDGRILAQVPMG